MKFIKKKPTIFYLILLKIFVTSCTNTRENIENKAHIPHNIPSIEEVSGIWVAADTTAMEPSIRNFRGQALLNRDMTSVSWFASAPFSGGYHTGVMKINGEVPLASMFRWQPYQALRKSKLDNLEILSSTRMLPDEDGIMWRVEITNTSDETRDLKIDLDMIGFISKYEGDWQWWYPYPKMEGKFTTRDDEVESIRKFIGKSPGDDEVVIEKLVEGKPTGEKTTIEITSDETILQAAKYSAKIEGKDLFVKDSETDAITGFGIKTPPTDLIAANSGGTATWNLQLKKGEKKVIQYFMAYGDDKEKVKNSIEQWKVDFDQKFNNVKTIWEEKWANIFTPGNDVISGCFPVLETNDTLVSKVYYMGPMTMLYLLNNNLPAHESVILTGGPRWGASISFFWDNTEWSTLQAVADPELLKDNILAWVKIDPGKYYGQDNLGGKGVGNGYSANYWALFQLIHAYITVTGDYEFLNEKVTDKTLLETLEHYATNWERISIYGEKGATSDIYKLADFGDDEWNLLECVPTYKHIVPSFNAGYIWMMRETASLYKKMGNEEKARTLNKKAAAMIPLLMKLYAGNGVWNSVYPGNKTIEVRHCLDFMFMGRYLPDDLSAKMKSEMIDFLYEELMTDHWMRAQSLKDVAAKNSDRPDHGPMGAFDGWPAGTMDALSQMGYPQKALDFYRAIEQVTYEGTWAQAHELWGENKNNKNARVRIAERGWHNRDSNAGIGMSQVVLKNFFGFYPEVNGQPVRNFGETDLEGKLHHVLYEGKYHTITLQDGKIKFKEED